MRTFGVSHQTHVTEATTHMTKARILMNQKKRLSEMIERWFFLKSQKEGSF